MTSSSQEILLASSPEGPITAYDISTGATLAHFSGSRCPRKGLALAGKTLIATSHISPSTASGSICLYNWWSSAAFYHLPLPEPVAPLAATSDGLFLFAGGLSGQIHALSLPSGDLLRSLPAHRKPVMCLAISGDGSLLISGGDDGLITVFPILRLLDSALKDDSSSSQFALYQFSAHPLPITAIASGTGGCNSTVISCSLDSTCKLWNLTNGTHMRTVRFPCLLWCVTMDPGEWAFYAGGSDGKVHVGALKVSRRQSSNDAEVVAWEQEHSGPVTTLAMANDGRNLVSGSEDGGLWVWEVESGRVVRVVGEEKVSVSDLVVAKGVGSSGVCYGVGMDGHGLGFSGREVCRPVREVREMEEWLGVVMKDRRRAIDVLEGAIGTYEKLLTLLLNEARGGKDKDDGEGSL